jgi:hypothetical protein
MITITNKNGDEWRDLSGWESYYFKDTGHHLNLNTLRKRRQASGLGTIIPPRTILLTHDEFVAVLETPLPGCTSAGSLVRTSKAHRSSPSGRE